MTVSSSFVLSQPHTVTLDFTKPSIFGSNAKSTELKFIRDSFSVSSNSSFMSSTITGDGNVSNGKQGSSIFLTPAISAKKPPLSSVSYSKKRCHEHDHFVDVSCKFSGSASGKCHCSKRRFNCFWAFVIVDYHVWLHQPFHHIMLQVVQEALDKVNLIVSDLTAIAVTIGLSLSLCLPVDARKARKLAGSFSLPIIGVHHMEAHALVARLTERKLQFPFMTILISGGNNLLILACELGQYVQLGTTIDGAIG